MTPAAKLRGCVQRRVKALGGKVRNYKSVSQAGVADLLVWLPGGRVILCEVKAGNDTIKPLQRNEAATMGKLGHVTWFVHNESDVEEMLK